MSEVNGTVVTTTGATVGTPTTPEGPKQPKLTLRERFNVSKIQFQAKHPKLYRAGKWTGRAIVGAGLFILGRKTAKPVYIQATVSEPEPAAEEPKEPEVEEETPVEEI